MHEGAGIAGMQNVGQGFSPLELRPLLTTAVVATAKKVSGPDRLINNATAAGPRTRYAQLRRR